VLTKKEENQLLAFKRKVLQTISGPKIENCVYRRKHELDKEFDSPNARTQWKEKSRKTEIQVGGKGEQR
jgi:hypothetical protein